LTNGTSIAVGVTNTSTESKAIALVQKLLEAINAAPALAGPDGLVAEDIVEGWFGSASFNLRARSPGPEAAGLSVRFEAALSLGCSPGPSAFQLQQNLADLQPRAHVMVRSGQALLRSGFLWDTRRIPDGSHELAAVAYEGSHVEAQTKLPLSVEIRNTELGAELSLPGPSDLRSVSLPVSVQVTANTSEVATIQLFSTGGLQGTFTNQSAATFTISGEQLGAGLHPFFALVESTTGQRYRTPTRYLRLTNP
jgi:hypothetical protein